MSKSARRKDQRSSKHVKACCNHLEVEFSQVQVRLVFVASWLAKNARFALCYRVRRTRPQVYGDSVCTFMRRVDDRLPAAKSSCSGYCHHGVSVHSFMLLLLPQKAHFLVIISWPPYPKDRSSRSWVASGLAGSRVCLESFIILCPLPQFQIEAHSRPAAFAQ